MNIFIKIISFIAGCCFVLILMAGSNSRWFDSFMNYVPSPYRYGDLYLFSSTPGYRKLLKPVKLKSPVGVKNKNYSLTIIGDSYLADLDSSFFSSDKYHFIPWNDTPDTINKLDKNKKNILIIESSERYIRWRFKHNNLVIIGKKTQQKEGSEIKLLAENNLQYMLTHFDFELPFKELKTSIYLKYFDKFSPMVARPDGSGRLYLEETINQENNASSFNPITDIEIESLVENLNKIRAELLVCGFDEIYISIIPSPASIYKSSYLPYNHLIERVEQHPKVKFKIIDIYKPFKQEKMSLYFNSDSHWNYLGKTMWLIKANQIFE